MIPRPREVARAPKAARVSTALVEERHPPSQPRGGIRIVESGESPPSLPRGPNWHEGEREGNSLFRTSFICGIVGIPSFLKALMLDLLLFEEPLLKDPDEEVISLLGFVYKKKVTKKL